LEGNIIQLEKLNYGDGLPACGLGGGFTVVNDPIPDMQGTWLVLGAKRNDTGEGAILTPGNAFYIDKRLGNGDPKSGAVRALEEGRLTNGKCIVDGRYNLSEENKSCVLYFKINE
jgi:hypothetical protein